MTTTPEREALAAFTDYFVSNYPGPNTIIRDPRWHAPKIFRAAQHALAKAPKPQEARTDEPSEAESCAACLGDDAVMLRELDGEGFEEVADNMDLAVRLLTRVEAERDADAADARRYRELRGTFDVIEWRKDGRCLRVEAGDAREQLDVVIAALTAQEGATNHG